MNMNIVIFGYWKVCRLPSRMLTFVFVLLWFALWVELTIYMCTQTENVTMRCVYRRLALICCPVAYLALPTDP